MKSIKPDQHTKRQLALIQQNTESLPKVYVHKQRKTYFERLKLNADNCKVISGFIRGRARDRYGLSYLKI